MSTMGPGPRLARVDPATGDVRSPNGQRVARIDEFGVALWDKRARDETVLTWPVLRILCEQHPEEQGCSVGDPLVKVDIG